MTTLLSLMSAGFIHMHTHTRRKVVKTAGRAGADWCTIYSMQEHGDATLMAVRVGGNYQAASPQAWLIILKD